MCLYLLLCIEPRNCQVNFARKKRTWKSHTCQCSQTEGAFHKLHWYELIWQVLDSPFFLMLAITQCTVMVIEAQHWFRAGARLHYSGSISRALKQWSMKLTVLPPLCIETERQLMCHSLLVNSKLKQQFKGRTDLNTTSPEKIWLIKIENVNLFPCLCSV